MSKIFVFFLTIFVCSAFEEVHNLCQNNDDLISWSETRKLIWNDFAGDYDSYSKKRAYSEIFIDILNVRLENNIPKYDIGCLFVKSKSWIRICEDNTLQKQQLEFDIYELHARKIRKSFDSLTVLNDSDATKYQKVFEDMSQASALQQAAFNLEVNKNPKKLKAWVKRIDDEIRQLESFASAK